MPQIVCWPFVGVTGPRTPEPGMRRGGSAENTTVVRHRPHRLNGSSTAATAWLSQVDRGTSATGQTAEFGGGLPGIGQSWCLGADARWGALKHQSSVTNRTACGYLSESGRPVWRRTVAASLSGSAAVSVRFGWRIRPSGPMPRTGSRNKQPAVREAGGAARERGHRGH
jgi:hypothetical protein